MVVASRIVEDNILNTRASEKLKKVSDFSVSLVADMRTQNAVALYNRAVAKGREEQCRVLIVNSLGIVVTDSYSELNGIRLFIREISEILTSTRDTSLGYHKINANEQFWAAYYSSAIIDHSQVLGAVVFSMSVQDVVDKTNDIKRQYFFTFGVTALLILLFAFLLTNQISRQLFALREAATKIGRGELGAKVGISAKDEIGELALAFNIMSDKITNVDKARQEFVSNASHELKTPLTSIKLLTESMLYNSDLSPEIYNEFLTDINIEVDRLTNLINDLLLMTKLEDRHMKLNIAPVELAVLIEKIINSLKPIASSKNVNVELSFEEPVSAECDELKIHQAIVNLIENAIKYSKQNGKVKVALSSDTENAYISVIDYGEGIDEDELTNIFDRFYRVDKARSRETGGSGLGLHIVRQLVFMHSGRLEVKSEPQKGSEFTIILPLISGDKQ